MNLEKIIKNKLNFLTEIGYSYNSIGKNHIFRELQFCRGDITIAFHFDCYNEFLDLTIKKNMKYLIKTNYDSVVMDNLNWEKSLFSKQLKEIYGLPRNSYSIPQKQFIRLVDLYIGFIVNSFCDNEWSK